MQRIKAIRLTFAGLALFAIAFLARDWVEGLFSYQSLADELIEDGWLKALGALIALSGVYLWVTQRPE